MDLSQMRALIKKVISSILCFTLAMTFTGFGGIETANAAVSPLITSYKPQAVSADVNASYTDANGNTVGATTQNWIGRSQYTTDPYLDGRVDDFRIYNQALSAGEIAALAGL